VSYVAYANGGALIKRSLAELIRAGCRVERVAHDPPTVRYRRPDGVPGAIGVDGGGYTLGGPLGTTRFHSVEALLAAATRTLAEAAS
jgi:hypothetical protein